MAARIRSAQQQLAYSTRPELGSFPNLLFHHQYQELNDTSNMITLLECSVERCSDAAVKMYSMERQLFEDGTISKENPALPCLEKSIYDLACNKSLSEGLVYCLCLKYNEFILARYIESGCYQGFMKNGGSSILQRQNQLEDVNLLKVYTENDLKKNETEGSCKVEQAYNRLLVTNKNSVKNQLALLRQAFFSGDREVELLGLTVHCIRKNANPSVRNHRYLSVYPQSEDSIKQWEDALKHFIVSPATTDFPQLVDMLHTPWLDLSSLSSQCSFLSMLSNDHWLPYIKSDGKMSSDKGFAKFLQHLLFQVQDETRNADNPKPLYYPTSIRNRLLYFSLHEDKQYVRSLCGFYISQISPCSVAEIGAEHSDEHQEVGKLEHQPKRRKLTERVIKDTPQAVDPFSKNVSVKRSLYVDFSEQLIVNGRISMRSIVQTGGVILMNDYSDQSGHFMPNSFCHLTFSNVSNSASFECSCSSFCHIQQQEGDPAITCMHCRFVKEYLIDVCKNPLSWKDLPCQTQACQKLLASDAERNCGVVVLSDALSSSTVKMSVMDKDGGCAFVHLSICRKYVTCQDGACQALMRNKKKTLTVLRLDNNERVCQHLQTLHSLQEVWSAFLPNFDQAEETTAPDDEVNSEDQDVDQNVQGHFDTASNLWNFGGLSQHVPLEHLSPVLAKCAQRRASLIDGPLKRNNDHYLVGPDLIPPRRETCLCGAGYDEGLTNDYETRLFTRYGVVKVQVMRRECLRKSLECVIPYSGVIDGIHQWSREICAGDELGWDFVNCVLGAKMSFTGFVKHMTTLYQSVYLDSPCFMSVHSFVSWFFSWIASMKIDFREHVDPWCKHSPKFLAGDGTHVGVGLRYIDRDICIEKSEIDAFETPAHKRYNRVFIPYDGVNDSSIRRCRSHLEWCCLNILSLPCDELNSELQTERNNELLSNVRGLGCYEIIRKFLDRDLDQQVLHKLAYILRNLSKDAPVVAFLPWRFHDDLIKALCNMKMSRDVQENIRFIGNIAPEFSDLLRLSVSCICFVEIVDFVLYLIKFVQDVHSTDRPSQEVEIIPGSYNPEKGIAYYFTPHGCQVRTTPRFNIKGTNNFDDQPEVDPCSKMYPSASRGGFSYMFLWFCPIHGHSYGFHLIPGSEGRKDPFPCTNICHFHQMKFFMILLVH